MGHFTVTGATLELDIQTTDAEVGDTRTVAGETFRRKEHRWVWESRNDQSLPTPARVYTAGEFLILSTPTTSGKLAMYSRQTHNLVKIRDDSEPWAWRDVSGFEAVNHLGDGRFELEQSDYQATAQLANRDELVAIE